MQQEKKEKKISNMETPLITPPKKEAIMPILKTLNVGQTHTYPSNRINTIKATITAVSTQTGRTFKTRLQRPYIHVTRIK